MFLYDRSMRFSGQLFYSQVVKTMRGECDSSGVEVVRVAASASVASCVAPPRPQSPAREYSTVTERSARRYQRARYHLFSTFIPPNCFT